jgi:hypothetical protein
MLCSLWDWPETGRPAAACGPFGYCHRLSSHLKMAHMGIVPDLDVR